MYLERYVWVVALVRYFDQDAAERAPMAAVLDAMGVTERDFQDARELHEQPIVSDVIAGKDTAALQRFLREVAAARRAIEEARPTLDDLRPPAATVLADETMMAKLAVPAVALPFRASRPGDVPPARTTPDDDPRSAPAGVEETLAMPLRSLATEPLPFREPADDTVIQPNPLRRPRDP